MDTFADAARMELRDPSTSPDRLAELAQAFDELHEEIAAHPAVYPALLDWMKEQSTRVQPTPAAARHGEPDLGGAGHEARETDQEHRRGAAGTLPWSVVGISAGVGAVVGAVVALVLVIWVLPGLFGAA